MRHGEISVQTYPHPRTGAVTIPVRVHHLTRLDLVLHSGLTSSAISTTSRDELLRGGALQAVGGRERYRLTGLTVQGQALPDLEVVISRGITRLGVDGMLGLDFLFHFEHIHFHVPTLRLILENPVNGASSP